MADMNVVTLSGRLTRDPELSYTPNNTPMAKFSVACETGWGDKKATSFFDCVCFGKRAEPLQKFFHKGDGILISGRLEQDRWEDKQTGAKRSKIGVIVENWSFPPGGKGEKSERPAARREPEADSYADEDPQIPF